MVNMIPPYMHPDIKSMAEKKIFDLFSHEELLDDWLCFHSLGVSEHQSKVEGEIDFLFIGPEGIFCLEVKGGRVTREDGIWKFTDRFGRINNKNESPFKQAASAMYSLRNNIKSNYPSIAASCLFGYGVIFPDIIFDVTSPEWNQEIVYDLIDRKKPFNLYLKRLISYWKNNFSGKRRITLRELENITHYIRGDFELVESLGNRISELEEKVIKLTENQYKALDRMENNKRIFFRGTAGTGKTLIAVEKMKRVACSGSKVLLLCYNKILGGKLNTIAKAIPNSFNVTADSIHKYFYNIITQSSLRNDFVAIHGKYTGEELFIKKYPDYFIQAIYEIEQEYDYLIVDEGQDLLCYEYFVALDYVIKGGLENGKWIIFYDSNNQGKLYQNFDNALVNDLVNFGGVEYWLDVNCRNTQHIATQTSVISGFKVEKTMIREGEKVQFHWYESESEVPVLLKRVVKGLISNNVLPGDITVLYHDNRNEHLLKVVTGLSCGWVRIEYDNAGNLPKEMISYCSVQGYKGMENKVIIYIGLEIEDDWSNTVNYVAMTRARQMLILIARENLKELYGRKSINFLKGGLSI